MDAARQVGPYTIEAEIGRGGMGIVYRGRDSRLERLVAIKALPPDVTADQTRLARFDREARLLAGVSHPNIATVYGLEADAGARYLVMELIEGETLVKRLSRGRLPIEEALAVAAQIAAGVEAAHDRAIIHRDLKPANVMISPEGVVKVLDFGVAREADRAEPSPTAATIPVGVTREGIAVRTPGYMSPEQARGREVDRRTDVFALGCILFECLCGVGPFHARTTADSIAATLEREPEWSLLPERTPTRIRELLEHCLEKDARRRLRDIGDVRLELERVLERREWASTGSMRAAGPGARRSRKNAVPWVVAGFAVAGGAVAVLRGPGVGALSPGTEPRQLMRFVVNQPEVLDDVPWDVPALAISDDGSIMAFSAGPSRGVFIRRVGDPRPVRLDFEDSAFAHSLSFSADGRWLAYVSGFTIYQVQTDGRQRVRLFQGEGIVKGYCWAPGGLIVSSGITAGLSRVNTETGQVTTLTTPDRTRGEASHRWPELLPDGRHVLFTIKRDGIETFDDADIALLDMESGRWRVVIEGGTYPRYAATGHIVFARAGGLLAAPFNASTGRVTATPIEVLRGVTTEPGSGAAQFALSRGTGTLLLVPGGPNVPRRDLVHVALDGTQTPLSAPPRNYWSAAPSPDGRRVALGAYGATDSFFVYDMDRGTSTRVTFDGNASNAFWSADGRRLAFTSDRQAAPGVYQVNAESGGDMQRLPNQPGDAYNSFVEFQGQESILHPGTDGVWVFPPHGEPFRVVSTPMPVGYAAVSPDGRWLAYSTAESGESEVYVRPFPEGEARWQVSIGGGFHPQWLPDSSGLVYRQNNGPLFVARWTSSPADARSDIFCPAAPNLAALEMLPDASGLVGVRRLPTATEPWRVEAVLNWLDDLDRRIPARPR